MKRHLLAVTAFVAAIASTQAQEQYRPVGGEGNLELMIAPLGGSPVTMAGIKYRHFGSATSAMRLGVFLGYQNKTTITQDENSVTKDLELKKKNSGITIAIQPGIEKHMTGTDRLSPYIGGYVNMPMKNKFEDVVLNDDATGTKTVSVDGKKDNVSSIQVGPNVVGQFRLGWIF